MGRARLHGSQKASGGSDEAQHGEMDGGRSEDGAQEEQGGPAMWIYLDLASLDDLAALYQEYLANAVKIAEPPTDQPWDMREMLVEDVDGHVLRIGAPHPHE